MTSQTTEPESTRALLIDVAEQLFATHGIEQVSLRTVGATAGQRNNSAAQYHFGSKEGLVEAIIATRSPAVDARRQQLADELRAGDQPVTVRSLARLFVQPLAETLAGGEETHYLRFLANAMEHPVLDERGRASRPNPPALRYMRHELRRLLPHLSRTTFARRMRMAATITFRVLAEHERRRTTSPSGAGRTDQVVEELLVALAALLQAPESGR